MTTLLSNIFNGGKDAGITGTGRRAAYALASHNTSSAAASYVLLDEDFRIVLATGSPAASPNYYGAAPIVDLATSTYSNYSSIFYNAGSTSSQATSTDTQTYLNGTNACGAVGNAMFDIYSNGTITSAVRNTGDWQSKHQLNKSSFNSDHSNKRLLYTLYNGSIRAVDKLFGSYSNPYPGTSAYGVTSLNTNMYGSASYHLNRKELVILSYITSGGSFNVFHFANVDFDTYPDPNIALNRPEVVRTNSTVSLASSWNVNNNESYYSPKPVITDNGTIYVSVFFTGNSLTLYSFTRNGSNAVTATYVAGLGTTTSYGADQHPTNLGQRYITSRDGTSVALFCPYYYYGTGVECYMIDKTNNTYGTYNSNQSGGGVQPLPFKDNGWAFYYAGNLYASNFTGGYISATYERPAAGGYTASGSTQFLSFVTSPNTTNYPGLTQVTDYDLLPPYNQYGAK